VVIQRKAIHLLTVHLFTTLQTKMYLGYTGGDEDVCILCCACIEHINSVGKPINLFMSVLCGLCDLSARES